ncbi:hypothetical protein AVEN_24393-1 [Araneus ventricosus]|uniref:Uncharacterized protein n=1 Tax=Araneus ventricosus TaxID=182803 RepID=A0A4Y2UPB4_ARAVE|nr:hypothetical protein AVEN_24393-1 [Araneus ventricosus]
MQWRPTSDIFTFQVTAKLKDNFSKREVLSNIASTFDPLGLIGSKITSAKIFLQRIRLQKLNCNDTVPPNDLNDWLKFLQDLQAVNKLEITRYAIITIPVTIDLLCFCDVLDKAYGAVLYLCCKNESGEVQTCILCRKSIVCPIKATTTPHLELSAALLLVRLVSKVISIIQVPINHIYMWTDSNIALAWIKIPHEKLKTYVSNPVKIINTLCPNYDWRHANSTDNPADLISMDEDNILRVGGCLQKTRITPDENYPKLLPAHLHVCPQTLLHLVRQEFWPVGGRNLARKIVN